MLSLQLDIGIIFSFYFHTIIKETVIFLPVILQNIILQVVKYTKYIILLYVGNIFFYYLNGVIFILALFARGIQTAAHWGKWHL